MQTINTLIGYLIPIPLDGHIHKHTHKYTHTYTGIHTHAHIQINTHTCL